MTMHGKIFICDVSEVYGHFVAWAMRKSHVPVSTASGRSAREALEAAIGQLLAYHQSVFNEGESAGDWALFRRELASAPTQRTDTPKSPQDQSAGIIIPFGISPNEEPRFSPGKWIARRALPSVRYAIFGIRSEPTCEQEPHGWNAGEWEYNLFWWSGSYWREFGWVHETELEEPK